MHRLQKPIRWNLAAHPCLPRPRQHFAADCGELQTETDVVAKTTDGIVLSAAGRRMGSENFLISLLTGESLINASAARSAASHIGDSEFDPCWNKRLILR